MILALLRFVGGALGRIALAFGIRASVTRTNLEIAYPQKTSAEISAILTACYRNLGLVFFEFLFLRFASKRKIQDGLEIENLQIVRNALSKKHGAILLSGHLANWEWLAMGCSLRLGAPLDVVVKNQRSGIAENFLAAMRTRFGNKMIDAGDVRAIYRSLRSGGLVAMLGDQAAPVDSVYVTFFSKEVPTFEGTARMALRTGAPIFFLQPTERTHKGYCTRFIEVAFDDVLDATDESVRLLTARHTAQLEMAIREKPDFWLWQHRRWKNAQ